MLAVLLRSLTTAAQWPHPLDSDLLIAPAVTVAHQNVRSKPVSRPHPPNVMIT